MNFLKNSIILGCDNESIIIYFFTKTLYQPELISNLVSLESEPVFAGIFCTDELNKILQIVNKQYNLHLDHW